MSANIIIFSAKNLTDKSKLSFVCWFLFSFGLAQVSIINCIRDDLCIFIFDLSGFIKFDLESIIDFHRNSDFSGIAFSSNDKVIHGLAKTYLSN